MTRTALAAIVLAAGCASPPSPAPAPLPVAYSVEVRFERSDGEVVLAPQLLVFAGQRAQVQVLRPVSYVQSFGMERQGEDWIADPIIGTVSGGILLDATTTPLADGSGARFDYRITVMEPGKVLPERKVRMGRGEPVTLQMPEVEKIAVEGAAGLPDGEDRAVAVLPWPGDGGAVTVWVRVHGTGFPAEAGGLEGEDHGLSEDGEEESAAAASPSSVVPAVVGKPGWFRLRRVLLSEEMEQGTVVEGEALRGLLEGGALTLERDLQWAGSEDALRAASVLVERPFLTDWDVVAGNDSYVKGPILQNFTSGLLVDTDSVGGLRCTTSSFLPMQTFWTSLGLGEDFGPVTIDLPEMHVRRGSLPSGPGERLLVLGPREGGGSDGVIVSFRPGATGPGE